MSGRQTQLGSVAALSIGFLVSSSLSFAAVGWFGLTHQFLSRRVELVVIGLTGLVLVGTDLISFSRGRIFAVGLRRQTPKNVGLQLGHFVGPMLWGLDTGLAFTTFRVVSITWTVFLLAGFGLAPLWIGAAYAFPFVTGLVGLTVVPAWRKEPAFGPNAEPFWIPRALGERRRAVQFGALSVYCVGSVLSLWTA